ncbi:hypothetical protein ASPWEDRAFT_34590 [Aspergillus wentii DTO 134E9]|uniref:Fe2OG dioxygenase domain-containing protein n=1 Tax=Aspergillus wentii DTO 134E9 TaxID=1073089 RepID=A0A1L9S1Q8_ASPWE|nr:uncharacterized protein ASPWEDRAFT_34590 [Aspergillus wentii DTO 134E9]KAI9930905.1 hypothetical protein MW887_010556 [Aspergillus wentii]OJJ41107.1 hypothetical protein ASPWEDRAFT_34590 [Aspergillus wentii DTO 134E9]
MATVGTLTSSPVPTSTAHFQFGKDAAPVETKPISQSNKAIMMSERVAFDPSKHLNFTPPSKVHTMTELGYSERHGISPIGVSEPFPLFSAEAIQHMRDEVLSDEVFAKHRYSSDLAPCQLRGFASECAPFVYDAWKNPETLAIISKIAGVDLVPAMDLEIGHVNISVNSEEEKARALTAAVEEINRKADEGVSGCPWEGDKPIVDWHTDSYPFVCVTMLSDCTDMIGGETALRKGDGDIVKVRGPQMGSAVILQGRYIEHQALHALGTTERISMVTSFRPRSSLVKDDTVLTTVRPISDLGELYHQFAEYRFEMLQDRFQDANKFMRDQKRARRPFDTRGLKQFIREQIEFLEHMEREVVDDDKVQKGVIHNSHLVSEDLKHKSKKRALSAVE